MVYCIYHSRDLDGWMSAAIVKNYFEYQEVELIGWDYGDDLPTIKEGERVIMVDVAFQKPEMRALNKHNNLTWIDHHISSIKELEDLDISGVRDNNFAACELTWKHFFTNEPMPEVVHLLGRYDCFGHKGTDEEERVLYFQYAARAKVINVDDCRSLLYASDTLDYNKWLSLGLGILNYLKVEAKDIYEKRMSHATVTGLKYASVNVKRFNPANMDIPYHEDGYDFFVAYSRMSDGRWTFSIYNDNEKVDVSKIAKNHGGGGHAGASGFIADNLEFVS
jgi:oligoribonuclease NrnB/cAMP/cGMP phosphodiesterase (DHH superfamily)